MARHHYRGGADKDTRSSRKRFEGEMVDYLDDGKAFL